MLKPENNNLIRITSRANPRVKELLKNRDNYHIFEGEKLVKDILRRKIKIKILIIHHEREGQLVVSDQHVDETWIVNESVMSKLSGLKEVSGYIAVLDGRRDTVNFHGSRSRVVIGLDNIQDPANAGTVLRCAAAFGIDAVAFSGGSVKTTNSRFLRAAQDAFFDVRIPEFETLDQLLKKAEKGNFNIYLTSSYAMQETVTPEQVKFPCLIVFGNEGQGLPERLFFSYPSIRISQTQRVESLNAGVSACIVMHELRKRF